MTKPKVIYLPPAKEFGDRAILIPINHRNHVQGQYAPNWQEVVTSPVVAWDKASGVIETKHTIYAPISDSDKEDETLAWAGKPQEVTA